MSIAFASGSGNPDPERLEIGVLGPLRVHRGGRVVLIGPAKQRLLLGVLALHPDRVVGREELIEVLWREDPPRSCHSLIYTYVARLRKLLDPAADVIVAAAGGYRLTIDSGQLDLLRFKELVAQSEAVQAADAATALALLADALDCWRDRVLADLPEMPSQDPAVVALTQRRIAAVLTHADLALELGQPQQAVIRLSRLMGDDPLHEGVAARLMLALAASGQQAAALEVFTRLRARLADELGVEPGVELEEAQARVLRGDLPAFRSFVGGPAVAVTPTPAPAQLPAEVAGFTGRVEAMQQLDAVLSADGGQAPTAVVVTAIAGMAGVGKTALAVHWAQRVAGRFGDGQLYIDLRGCADTPPLDPAQALAALLAGLGVEPRRIPVDLDAAVGLYRSLLAGKQVLVVLDNARDAAQVRPLLPGDPGCMVLITSRDRLTGLVATHGVHRITLDVLTPAEATALLRRLLGPERTAKEPDTVEELARCCAWLPLALRIAAANLISRPSQTIASYLAELQSGDRLTELAVDGDPHAAVGVAFGHSYQRIPPASRRLFRLLALAPGPEVSTAAAAALDGSSSDDAKRLFSELAAAHLVEPRGPGRVALHDLVREYAGEQTNREDTPDERAAALGRLYDWYLHATDTAAGLVYPDKLRLPAPGHSRARSTPTAGFDDAAGAIAWLEAERANLVACVHHAADHGPHPTAWRLADALRGYFALRRHTTDWLAVGHTSLTAASTAGDVHAQAASQLTLGDAYQATGTYQQAAQHYTGALRLACQCDWTVLQAICQNELGMVHWWSGNLQQAAEHHIRAQALHLQIRRPGGHATALINLSLAVRNLGHLRQSAALARHALTLHRQLGSRQGMANAVGHLGVTLHDLGQLGHATHCLTRSVSTYREVGDRYGQAWTIGALAQVHRDTGRRHEALDAAQTALRLARLIGHRSIEAATHNILASIHRCLGHHQEAIAHDQHALDLARQTRTSAVETKALYGLAAVHHALGHQDQARTHAEQAHALASRAGFRILDGQAQTLLAGVHHALGHHDQARTHAESALAMHRQTGHRQGQARALRVLGSVMRDTGDARSAEACWQEAMGLFTVAGSTEANQHRS